MREVYRFRPRRYNRNMVRIFGRDWMVLLIVSAGVTAGVGYANGASLETWSSAAAEEWLDAQAAVAEQMGLRRAESLEITPSPASEAHFDLDLAAGECVAVLAASQRNWASVRLELRDQDESLATGESHFPGTELQWCSSTRATLRVTAHVPTTSSYDSEGSPRDLLVRVYRGHVAAGLAGLRRGYLSDEVIKRLARERIDAVESRRWSDEARVWGPAEISLERGARLLPRTAATWRRFYRDAADDHLTPVHPRADTSPSASSSNISEATGVPELAEVGAAPPEHDALVRVGENWERVLAVIDTGALGTACIAVSLSSLGERTDFVVHALEPRAEALELVADDGVYIDERCPAGGVVTYSVRRVAGADYRLSVWRMPAPEGTPAARAAPPPLELEAELRRECDGASGASCAELAEHLLRDQRGGIQPHADGRGSDTGSGWDAGSASGVPPSRDDVDPRVSAIARRGCELGDRRACALLELAGGTFSPQARRIFREACDASVWFACAYLGDLERLGDETYPADYRRAASSYGRACEGGVPTACANLGLLDLRGLHVAPRRSVWYFTRACDGGVVESCRLALSRTSRRDGRAARHLRRQACALGDTQFCE